MAGVHCTWRVGRSTGFPSMSLTTTLSAVTTAYSYSSITTTSLVRLMMAGTSEARTFSPSPSPMTSGEASLAARMVLGSSAFMATMV